MFKFRYSIKPENLWVLTMVNFYRSFLGVCNLVFTVSMVLLAVRFWSGSSMGIRTLITAGVLLIPVFQPLMIYFRCRKIVSTMPGDMEISFDKTGITTSAKEARSHVNFSEVKSVIRIFNLMIIYTRSKQSFILSDRITEGKSTSLYSFIKENVNERVKDSRHRKN